ncbi:hypothetical protein [Micromonospora aurantiaca (nom. illeg.)]|uniref:hypothetical protein n=1 Tax=Micromonospora aurantiaca (nom. illeg.) TaxID=47850 RepID=UPI00366117B8
MAATERLLAGVPLRSNGGLTVVQLAVEADVKRWTLTHRHVDLMHIFQARAKTLGTSSRVRCPWRERVEELEKANRELREEIEDLRATVSCYAQVIDGLNTAVDSHSRTAQRLRSV